MVRGCSHGGEEGLLKSTQYMNRSESMYPGFSQA